MLDKLTFQVVTGDARLVVEELPPVHCVVTSPPYYDKMRYGTSDAEIGHESGVDAYVSELCGLFESIRLHPLGSIWVNIGDKRCQRTGGLLGVPAAFQTEMRRRGFLLIDEVIWAKGVTGSDGSIVGNFMTEPAPGRLNGNGWESIFRFARTRDAWTDMEAIAAHRHNVEDVRYLPPHLMGIETSIEGRRPTNVWQMPLGQTGVKHFACVDEETECLTTDGWKSVHEILPGMIAAQYDPVTGKMSWSKVGDVAVYQVDDQPMIETQTRDLKMMLTPNHRTLVASNVGDVKCDVIRADELSTRHRIPVSAVWDDGECKSPFSPEWAELIGWYVSEGCRGQSQWSVEIYQSQTANEANVRRIRDLLEATGADYSEAVSERSYKDRRSVLVAFQIRGFAAVRLMQWAPGKSKLLGWNVLRWSNDLLQALFRGLVGGDGCVRKSDGRESFIQKSEDVFDVVQAIAVRLGYATKKSFHHYADSDEGTWRLMLSNKRFISLRGTANSGMNSGLPTISKTVYSGLVWCPRTDKGTWIARRKGRVFITGNTFPRDLPERAIAMTCPPHVTDDGVPCRRIVEMVEYDEGKRGSRTFGKQGVLAEGEQGEMRDRAGRQDTGRRYVPRKPVTIGWDPDPSVVETSPGIVLDPFAGVGTVGSVALRMGRSFIGIEIYDEFADLAVKQCVDAMEMLRRDEATCGWNPWSLMR